MKATGGGGSFRSSTWWTTPLREAQAREAAEVALGLCSRIDRVVLACLARTDDPVVGVVQR